MLGSWLRTGCFMEGFRRNDDAVAKTRAEADKFSKRYASPTHDCTAFEMPCSCGYEEKFMRSVDRINELEFELQGVLWQVKLMKKHLDAAMPNSCKTKD